MFIIFQFFQCIFCSKINIEKGLGKNVKDSLYTYTMLHVHTEDIS